MTWSTMTGDVAMKRTYTALLAAFAAVGMSLAVAQQANLNSTLGHQIQPFAVVAPDGTPCGASTPGIIIHDDGEGEDGFGWQNTVTDGRFVEKFTPSVYPATFSTVCFSLITNAGTTSAPIDIIVYAADGAGGSPGTLLGTKSVTGHPVQLSGVPYTATFESFDISDLNINVTSGDVFIGVKWAPNTTTGVFVGADESTSTPIEGGYSWANAGPWQTTQTGQAAYRALMIRAVEAAAGTTPVVTKSFSPTTVISPAVSTLKITLANPVAAATLLSPLTDTFPSGLVVASTPNASTTCSGGSGVTTTSNSVTLATGAVIPAGGSCTVTVDVTSADGGTFANTIDVGALHTDQGDNPNAANATLTVYPAGSGNGIIQSGPLNHAVQATTAGTSLNIVTSALDDTGPISGDWDFNFWSSSSAFTFYTITTYATAYVVDGSGKAVVLHNGDVIGPSSTFSTGASVSAAAEWLAGTDGVVGVKFNCDGRLTFAVPSGVCYGYIHITTTGTTGFPATIVDTTFDGDGNPITVGGVTPPADPSATVTPTSLSMTAAANGTSTTTLNIANAAGSAPLTYSVEAREAALHPHVSRSAENAAIASKLSPAAINNPNLKPKLDWMAARAAARSRLAGSGAHGGAAQRGTPWVPTGSIAFILDDGSYEDGIGWVDDNGTPSDRSDDIENSSLWLNRFTATGALTIDSVSIMWPQNTAGSLVGRQVNIVAYYDADGDGDPSNAVRLGTDNLQTIGSLDAFESYTTNFSVPGAGDVYIGFFNTYANGGSNPALYPAAIDEDSVLGQSWVAANDSGDADLDLGANDDIGTIDDLSAGTLTGTWLIRATGTGGGSGGSCTGPVVSWLTATPANGSVSGGANTNLTVTANPAAGSLAVGSYSAELCLTTNDPTQPVIAVPVSLTVTSPPFVPCNGGTDEIFCDGFDGSAPNADIYDSGEINIDVPNTLDGVYINWEDGSTCTDGSCGGNFNPYSTASIIHFYWPNGTAGDPNEGGVGSASTAQYTVLASGATIGSASEFITLAGNPPSDMSNWAAGVNGYLGFKFACSTASSGVCYGYANITTTAPNGFPATLVRYWYDKSGADITIP